VPDLSELCDDLDAEHGALDALVAGLDEGDWHTPTPAPGWTIRNQIGHLTFVESRAVVSFEDADAFAAALAEDRSDAARFAWHMDGEPLPEDSASVLAAWRDTARRFVTLARAMDPTARVPWYGPPMRPASMVSARIMETWAHAEDVAETLGVERAPTARLRHIAHLGVGARRFSATVRGLEPDETPVRVELVAPDGDIWTWGADEAVDRIRGSALDFCRVVTRRRRVEDTGLDVSGPAATHWMAIAQAFAGPPGPDPVPRPAHNVSGE
jgi:uncharacterized protein (TIGR03084 family)